MLQEFSQLLCEGLRDSDRDGEGKPGYQDVTGNKDRSGGSDEPKKWSELGFL